MDWCFEVSILAKVEENEEGKMIITEIDGKPVEEINIKSTNKPLIVKGGEGNLHYSDWQYKYMNECIRFKNKLKLSE